MGVLFQLNALFLVYKNTSTNFKNKINYMKKPI